MSDNFLSPNEKHWTFWDGAEVFDKEEFFIVPMKNSREFCGSVGYFNGENLVWMLEYYHTAGFVNDSGPIFYVDGSFNPSDPLKGSMEECSKEDWLSITRNTTPQCLDWINFHLKDLNLI